MDIEFKIDKFEGPLDLLLHLVKINKMNILDIEIEKITENKINQFYNFVFYLIRSHINQVYKEITEKLKEKERNRKEIYTNSGVDIKQYVEDIEKKMETNVELDDLVNAFKKFLLRREEEKPIKTKITEKEITVQERKTRIKNILLTKKKISFYELFEDYNKEYIVATFLAILELTKEKTITIKQENTFSDIICEVI